MWWSFSKLLMMSIKASKTFEVIIGWLVRTRMLYKACIRSLSANTYLVTSSLLEVVEFLFFSPNYDFDEMPHLAPEVLDVVFPGVFRVLLDLRQLLAA